ncbi:MAG: ATP-grasp domain-containing protein, partial [Planctomycetes bacterium]|nr:ATP-grasp domain-containing protein [Planctomycetota bacterium]
GIPRLQVQSQSDTPTRDGSFLIKPIASAGGREIAKWDENCATPFPMQSHYFQHVGRGTSCSAVYVVRGTNVVRLGATRQLVGLKESNAPTQFAFCGSIGPIDRDFHSSSFILSEQAKASIDHIASVLFRSFKLNGLFGIDFLVEGDDVRLLEVNPRYPASVEVLELSLQQSVLSDLRVADFTIDQHMTNGSPLSPMALVLDSEELNQEDKPQFVAKGIVYAKQTVKVPDWSQFYRRDSIWTVPDMADIPSAGSLISMDHPVCTVFASDPDWQKCEEQLKKRILSVCHVLDQCCVVV